jgi:hypothetical protein
MSFAWLPCAFLCLASDQGLDSKLEIVNHRPTYGYLGAPRPKVGLLPGDKAHFTFEIKNLKLDDNGKAFYSIAIEIRDAAGKLIYEQRPHNSVAQNFLGGDTLPCSAYVEIPFDAKPGDVDWKVTVKDRTTKQVAILAGKGKILEPTFGIVQVGLFADPDLKVPMSAIAVVGDSAYLNFSAVGFERDKDKKQPDLNVSMRIVDDKGKATLAKPLMGKIDSGVGVKDDAVPITFGVTMNRAGRFTIELTAEDRLTGKTATIAYAIRVLPLE